MSVKRPTYDLYLIRENGRPYHQRHLKEAMGIPDPKDWPPEGMPVQTVAGVQIYVKPRNTNGRRTHRAFAICPSCQKHIPAGRMGQHCIVHKPKE